MSLKSINSANALFFAEGCAFDSHRVNAWTHESDGLRLWLEGGEDVALPLDSPAGAHLQSLPGFIRVGTLWIKLASIVAFFPVSGEMKSPVVYLRGSPEFFPAPAMFDEQVLKRLPSGFCVALEDVVGWERHGFLFLESGQQISVESETDRVALQAWASTVFEESMPDVWVRPDAIVACRKNLAGPVGEALSPWVLYIRNKQYLPAAAMWKKSEWTGLSDGTYLDGEAIRAYVQEAPAHPGAPRRFAVYLSEGHELNFYGEEAIAAKAVLVPFLSEKRFVQMANGGFDARQTVALRWSGAWLNTPRVEILLAHGPGIPVTAPADLATIRKVYGTFVE